MNPSEPQELFLNSTERVVLGVGDRQSGKTEAITMDAVMAARSGEIVCCITPLYSHSNDLLQACYDFCAELPTNPEFRGSKQELVFPGGGIIEGVSSTDINTPPTRTRGYDRYYFDDTAYIDQKIVRTLVREEKSRFRITASNPTCDENVMGLLDQLDYDLIIPFDIRSNPIADPNSFDKLNASGAPEKIFETPKTGHFDHTFFNSTKSVAKIYCTACGKHKSICVDEFSALERSAAGLYLYGWLRNQPCPDLADTKYKYTERE